MIHSSRLSLVRTSPEITRGLLATGLSYFSCCSCFKAKTAQEALGHGVINSRLGRRATPATGCVIVFSRGEACRAAEPTSIAADPSHGDQKEGFSSDRPPPSIWQLTMKAELFLTKRQSILGDVHISGSATLVFVCFSLQRALFTNGDNQSDKSNTDTL